MRNKKITETKKPNAHIPRLMPVYACMRIRMHKCASACVFVSTRLPCCVLLDLRQNFILLARTQERMKIVIVASEIAPFSKSGGLADVSDKLGVALSRMGHKVQLYV